MDWIHGCLRIWANPVTMVHIVYRHCAFGRIHRFWNTLLGLWRVFPSWHGGLVAVGKGGPQNF